MTISLPSPRSLVIPQSTPTSSYSLWFPLGFSTGKKAFLSACRAFDQVCRDATETTYSKMVGSSDREEEKEVTGARADMTSAMGDACTMRGQRFALTQDVAAAPRKGYLSRAPRVPAEAATPTPSLLLERVTRVSHVEDGDMPQQQIILKVLQLPSYVYSS